MRVFVKTAATPVLSIYDDALGPKGPVCDSELAAFFQGARETFARALPFAYRACAAAPGSAVVVEVTGPVTLAWTLQHEADTWSLWSDQRAGAATTVRIPADAVWRRWTKGTTESEARARCAIDGNARLAAPVFGFVSIMA